MLYNEIVELQMHVMLGQDIFKNPLPININCYFNPMHFLTNFKKKFLIGDKCILFSSSFHLHKFEQNLLYQMSRIVNISDFDHYFYNKIKCKVPSYIVILKISKLINKNSAKN